MIYQFNSNILPPISEVSVRGRSLLQLSQAEFPVLPGFICSVAFFEPWLMTLRDIPEWETIPAAIHNEEDFPPSVSSLTAVGTKLVWTAEQKRQLAKAADTLPPEYRPSADTSFVARPGGLRRR